MLPDPREALTSLCVGSHMLPACKISEIERQVAQSMWLRVRIGVGVVAAVAVIENLGMVERSVLSGALGLACRTPNRVNAVEGSQVEFGSDALFPV